MNNHTTYAFGPNETNKLIEDINEWKAKRIEIIFENPKKLIDSILASEIEANKLLTRCSELL